MSETMSAKRQRWPGDDGIQMEGDTLIIDGVRYLRHVNGGGWVAETAQVADSAFVGLFAQVCDTAQVEG